MKERPILFNAEMVRAILAGKKTQTRRPVKPQPRGDIVDFSARHYTRTKSGARCRGYDSGYVCVPVRCPYGVPGDLLWVRERINRRHAIWNDLSGATYDADLSAVMGTGPDGSYLGRALCYWQWQRDFLPSIFMPRWASRINLEITDMQVEQATEPDDAAKTYDTGDWVWVVEFKVIRGAADPA